MPEHLTNDLRNLADNKNPNLDKTDIVNLGDDESVRENPRLSTDIVSHRFPINSEYCPVKQKTRKFKPDLSLRIMKEVMKQIELKRTIHIQTAKRVIHIQMLRRPLYSNAERAIHIQTAERAIYIQMPRRPCIFKLAIIFKSQEGHSYSNCREGHSYSNAKKAIVFKCREGHSYSTAERAMHTQTAEKAIHIKLPREPLIFKLPRGPFIFKCQEGHCIQDAERAIHIQIAERIIHIQTAEKAIHIKLLRGPSYSKAKRAIISKCREGHSYSNCREGHSYSNSKNAIRAIHIQTAERAIHIHTAEKAIHIQTAEKAIHTKLPRGPSYSKAKRAIILKSQETRNQRRTQQSTLQARHTPSSSSFPQTRMVLAPNGATKNHCSQAHCRLEFAAPRKSLVEVKILFENGPSETVYSNYTAGLEELAVRVPNLLEPWTEHMYA
uniref:Uncharacterized protein n=1 Tax=Solanum lycopersicum TaxID=4081 RepID=A0A3Q7IVL6_SOLLC